MDEAPDLDAFDRRILKVVALNGRITVADLAARVGLSRSPVQARLRRLERRGAIRGYRAVLDPRATGLGHVAFVEVRLSDTREAALAAFNAAVLALPAIEACHMIAGSFDYLLRIDVADVQALDVLLRRTLAQIPGVARFTTMVATSALVDRYTEL